MNVTADDYTIEGKKYARVSRILEHCGLTDFSKIPASKREWVMERGRQVHLLFEHIERGVDDGFTYDPEVEQYRAAHARFLRETGFEAFFDGIEQTVWSDELRVAGTLDRFGKMQGRVVLLDYKTTSLVPATHIQTAFYALMIPQFRFEEIERRGVAFQKNGAYKMSEQYPLSDKREAIDCARRYHREIGRQ